MLHNNKFVQPRECYEAGKQKLNATRLQVLVLFRQQRPSCEDRHTIASPTTNIGCSNARFAQWQQLHAPHFQVTQKPEDSMISIKFKISNQTQHNTIHQQHTYQQAQQYRQGEKKR
jgi:hypothetical protein